MTFLSNCQKTPTSYTNQEGNLHALKTNVSNQTFNKRLPTPTRVFLINNIQKLTDEGKNQLFIAMGQKVTLNMIIGPINDP